MIHIVSRISILTRNGIFLFFQIQLPSKTESTQAIILQEVIKLDRKI